MSNDDLPRALWRKSSRSTEQGQCVELAQNMPGIGALRDSKAPEHGALVVKPHLLNGFLDTVKAGKFDL